MYCIFSLFIYVLIYLFSYLNIYLLFYLLIKLAILRSVRYAGEVLRWVLANASIVQSSSKAFVTYNCLGK